MRKLLFNGYLFVALGLFVSCHLNEYTADHDYEDEVKQKGMHVFGQIDSVTVMPLNDANVEWLSFVPFGHQEDFDSVIMEHHDGDSLKIIQRNEGWVKKISVAQDAGFKVFLKPHIWVYNPSPGTWRSDIFPSSDENWILWKESYRDFILRYARIAEEQDVEMFCIGTELTRVSLEKEQFWRDLIKEVRSIYSGQLTYAANWYKEFENIAFWDALDYIGVQAYFPLVKNHNPSVSELAAGWKKPSELLESMHKKYKRKIIFTEMGYKSTSDSGIAPWTWIDYSEAEGKPPAFETQSNCYKAFFDTVWRKEWFYGVHFWQWRTEHARTQRHSEVDFTPQGKPAATIIQKGFSD